MVKFRNIKGFTKTPAYKVDIGLEDFKRRVEKDITEKGLELNPDFQRGHVWTREQQIKFVEYILRGGESGRDLYFNHKGWFRDWKGPYVCVDGLQRITAIMAFLNNEIPAFGGYLEAYEDALPIRIMFHWHVNDLQDEKEVLNWYLEMNEGGTPHSKEELERVREMINDD